MSALGSITLYQSDGDGIASPGNNTDAIADVTFPARAANRGAFCRVTVQLATGSFANLMVSRDGTDLAYGLNGSTPLTAGSVYTFDVAEVAGGDLVNFQVETTGVISRLKLEAVNR